MVLASCSTAVLGLLALTGALHLAPFAALENLSPHWLGDHTWLTLPAAWPATALLAFGTVKTVSLTIRTWRELRTAWSTAGGPESAGGLSVSPDSHPYAYALPGRRGSPGRIVVSAAMLRALDPREREALFAHERAHLTGRHHLFLGVAHLAATLHPVLRGLREPLAYALERWADEAAATAVGDRRPAARAIGRAALAAHQHNRRDADHPRTVLTATSGPVPLRVSALLQSPSGTGPSGRRSRCVIAVALLVCLAATTDSAMHAADDLPTTVEIAQSDTASY
ncbi:M56 family metallopeptidase [Streptomyces sp. NPDC002205]|uniref:M56 family metallopeptidase n=1 Tax=Streptomyces sp. NPDC002205 TaxID=3154411 RepID=UPI003322D3BC